MNTNTENNELVQILTLKIEPADYEEKVNQTIKNYRKQIKIDGFRPGAVPVGIIKKRYGTAILIEEVNTILTDKLQNHIRDNNLSLLGEPLPNVEKNKPINWDTDTEFEFVFDIAVAPEIDVQLDSSLKLTQYNIQVTDDMLHKQIEQWRAMFGKQETVDTIEGTEMVKGVLTQLNTEEPHVKEAATILLSKIAVESEVQVFKNAKIGDIVEFNPKKALENDTELSSLLAVDKENHDVLYADYNFEITDILRFTPAELNQEFYDKALGESAVSSEEELNERVKSDLSTEFAAHSDMKLIIDAKNYWVENTKFDLPEGFLKRWLSESNKDNDKITDEMIEKDFEPFLKDLRWQLISGKIMKDNDIKILPDEIREEARIATRNQLKQYGFPTSSMSDEELDRWSVELLKDESQARRLYEELEYKKITQLVKEKATLTNESITIDDFKKFFE